MNTIVYADELSAEARASGADWTAAHAAVKSKAMAEHPMYLGIVTAVQYLEKSDRYVAKFDSGTAKVTDEVAQFLLTEAFHGRGAKPTVYAHMDKGTIDGVLLMFVAR